MRGFKHQRGDDAKGGQNGDQRTQDQKAHHRAFGKGAGAEIRLDRGQRIGQTARPQNRRRHDGPEDPKRATGHTMRHKSQNHTQRAILRRHRAMKGRQRVHLRHAGPHRGRPCAASHKGHRQEHQHRDAQHQALKGRGIRDLRCSIL